SKTASERPPRGAWRVASPFVLGAGPTAASTLSKLRRPGRAGHTFQVAGVGMLIAPPVHWKEGRMSRIEQSIDVDVPVETAYNQWTQFEEFPPFMDGVKQVEQLDERRLRWHAAIGGVDKSWEAEITEQVPDERVAWRSVEGAANAGVVTFHRLSDRKSRVMLQL